MHDGPRQSSLPSPRFSIVRWEKRRVWLFCRVDVPIVRLADPLIFSAALNGAGGLRVEVPEGTESDFASIPPELWWILSPWGRWALAAVAHDYLYSRAGVSRFLADAIFRELMHRWKVRLVDRLAIYYAVRFFGGRHKTRKADA